MTLRLGNKKVCPTKIVKVNNVDWNKAGYVFGNYGTDSTYDKVLSGKVYAASGVYPRATADETGTTKFVNFSQPFEINFEFTAPTIISHNHVLFGNGFYNQYFRSPACEYQANSSNVTFWAGLSTSGSTWNYGLSFTPDEIPKVAGDIYNVNYKYDGSRFILSVTHNDVTLTKSVEVTGTPYYSTHESSDGTYLSFGRNAGNGSTPFEGYFNAWNTYIKQNDVLVWGCEKGRNYVEVDPNNYLISNVTKVGAIEDDKGVLSSFAGGSSPKYAHSSIPSIGNNTWEFNVDFTTGNTLTYQETIGISTRGASPFYLWSDGGLRLFLSNNGTSWDIYNPASSYLMLSTNTNYQLKCAFDGSKYTVSRYVNDEWVVLETVTSSTSINSDNKLWIGINQRGSTPSAPFLGNINLNSCSLKVDGQTVWQGVVPQGTRG